jgi:hypothetical protein
LIAGLYDASLVPSCPGLLTLRRPSRHPAAGALN